MNKSFVTTIGAAAIASLAMFSAPAFANTDLGTLTDGYNASGSLGKVSNPDVVLFEIGAVSEFVTLSATIAGSVALATTQLVISENINGTWTVIASDYFTKNGFWNAAIGTSGSGLLLTTGEYSFTFVPAGTDTTHSVGYSVAATAVPEISTWGMMLSGFAAIGFAGYRRKTTSFAV